MIIIKYVLCIFGICFIVICGTDLIIYTKDTLSHWHIGKWDGDSYQRAWIKIAEKWLYKTPTVKMTDNNRYVLLDVLKKKYRNKTIQSWQIASVILGLKSLNNPKVDNIENIFFNSDYTWKNKPAKVAESYLSYAILKTSNHPEKLYNAMNFTLNMIKEHVDSDGIIRYIKDTSVEARYVDTLGLVCPFLVLYGKIYNDNDAVRLALNQIFFYRKYGFLDRYCLPNHAISKTKLLPLGIYGWGRGCGWYILSLVETYDYIEDSIEKKTMKKWIKEAAESYKIFQHENGGFGAILQRDNTYDSSITAIMAYFYQFCGDLFNNKEYYLITDKCIGCLKNYTRRSGAIDYCQGDTKDIGIFSQTYAPMPFAQGFALRTIGKRLSNKKPRNG